ncbi:glutathione peroxidase [Pelosinus sp. sgz500959]|uniref:glutathione peroxidase n=1 Tax=Pelosinus sp. sgz500959 TaxID=3242472 RepID=UPI003671553A
MSIYEFSVNTVNGKQQSLSDYKGKVLLIVNTASKCGFTSQYQQLQQLYETYGKDKFTVLAFPCNQFLKQEPGSDQEIVTFCQINFGVTFPVFSKIDVKGSKADPLFTYLTEKTPSLLGKSIKWNFTKFLIDGKGNVYNRYAPITSPNQLIADIEKLLAQEKDHGQ